MRWLEDSASAAVFDRDEVYNPAVRAIESGMELFFTGCWWPEGSSECEPFQLGVGAFVTRTRMLLDKLLNAFSQPKFVYQVDVKSVAEIPFH